MPSRAAALVRVVCGTTTTNQYSSHTVATQPRPPGATQVTLNGLSRNTANRGSAPSLFDGSFYISRRHHHNHNHPKTQMDEALARIFLSNSQWAKAVNAAEDGFFKQSTEGQSPKVRPFYSHSVAITPRQRRPPFFFHALYAHIRSRARSSSGLDALTPASLKVLLRPLDRATSSFTATSPSMHAF
jgi:hypothetical protein